MSSALFLIHPLRREQPDALKMFSGSTKTPGIKVLTQRELLNYLEKILNLEITLSARNPRALQPAHVCHSGSMKVRTEAAGTLDIGEEMLSRVQAQG